MEPAANPLVCRLRDVRRTFELHGQTVHVLRGVDLDIRRGAAIGLTGPSGSGKSTLLSILALVDSEYEGAYEFEGRDPARAGESARAEWRLRRIGMAFQDLWLVDSLTAHENLLIPLLAAGVPADEGDRRADHLLEEGRVAYCRDRRPRELSGGERRRVAFARCLANDPALLLVDEPTAELDPASAGAVLAQVRGAQERGATLVAATHDPALLALCEERYEFRDGRLEAERPLRAD